MLKKRIIPCLDMKGGRVVKGVCFEALRDAGDPVETAALYDRLGADELCFLDIGASVENRGTLFEIVEKPPAGSSFPSPSEAESGRWRRSGGRSTAEPTRFL